MIDKYWGPSRPAAFEERLEARFRASELLAKQAQSLYI